MAEVWDWIGTLAFWSAACVIAALLWMTVQADGESVAPTMPGQIDVLAGADNILPHWITSMASAFQVASCERLE